jgi:hypothetical protein
MTRLLLRLTAVALAGSVDVSAYLPPPALAPATVTVLPPGSGVLAIATAAGPSAEICPMNPGADLPHNLLAPEALQPVLSRMWNESPTFRRQCARIHAEARLSVRLYTAASTGECLGRAATRIDARNAHKLEANVYLPGLRDAIELIAHEFEHILEYLDGVDLEQLAVLAPDTVWRTGDGNFETQRATLMGRLVATEVGSRSW